jgi:hypothetical protein
MEFYSLLDLVFGPLYLILILAIANVYANKKVLLHPEYKYFVKGLVAKLIGGIGLAFVYTFYYPGGDTLQYFYDSLAFQKLMFVDFDSFIYVFFRKADISNFLYFNSETGFPAYCRDPKAWFVVKCCVFIVGVGMHSYLATTIIFATLSFFGIWKLYLVFVNEFPNLQKELAISFLFIPSVFFWGSGLLKDTFTLSALGYIVWCLYNFLVLKKDILKSIIIIVLATIVILSIKPYILVGLLPAIIVWLIKRGMSRIKGAVLKAAAVPLLIICGFGIGYLFMVALGESLHEYKLDSILDKAVVNQRDLKSDYHKGNAFDIGEFDASVGSVLSKLPIAIFSAIFRPMIIETNNLVMFISGIENLLILIFTIRVLIRVKVFGLFRYIFKNELLAFSFVFAILFAFSVGLSTSNFGSLVRYKIPCIPFFVASLYIIYHLKVESEKEDYSSSSGSS